MPRISFDQLYDEDKNMAQAVFLSFCNKVTTGLNLPSLDISPEVAHSFVSNLRKDEFPACNGFTAASPFKKAANLYVWLHAVNPFNAGLPEEVFGKAISKFGPSGTASVFGYIMVKSALSGVELNKSNGVVSKLTCDISVSSHYLVDMVEASQSITPETHFKTFSILFEALVYEANAGVSYPKAF
jgi:hypothetical protein